MKKTSFVILLATMLIGLSSCKKEKEITCNLSKSDQAPVDMTITFKATRTGDGVITSLTYQTSEKTETIPNPILPWTINAEAAGSTTVTISATGTVKNGSLKIEYHGISGGDEIEGSDYCSQESD